MDHLFRYAMACLENWKAGHWLMGKSAAEQAAEPSALFWMLCARTSTLSCTFFSLYLKSFRYSAAIGTSAALLYILLKLGAVPAFVGRSIVIVAHSWSWGVCPFSFPDALCYQIRGKHVFPNAVISQRYKLQLYHIEKGMRSAPFSISTENVYRIEL